MDCRDAARFVQLRLDDEIEPVDCLQLDHHLESCPRCRDHVDAELRFQTNIKQKLRDAHSRADVQAPSDLAARIVARMDQEQRGESFPMGRAAAACLAMFMIGALSWGVRSQSQEIVEETIARHTKHLPPEIRADLDEEAVRHFLRRNLQYPVSVPQIGNRTAGTRFVGARLANIGNRDVAYMMYDHRGARVSVFAHPRMPELADPDGFERVKVGDRVINVGARRGYNVLSWQDRDLQYSLVSDVDRGELLHLVSAQP